MLLYYLVTLLLNKVGVLKEHGVAILSCDAAAKQGRSSRSTVLLYSLVTLLLNKVGPQGAQCCYTLL